MEPHESGSVGPPKGRKSRTKEGVGGAFLVEFGAIPTCGLRARCSDPPARRSWDFCGAGPPTRPRANL